MTRTVTVLYNHVGEDEYAQLKDFDESQLGFEPEYDVAVATAEEEYAAIVTALESEGYEVRLVNIEERLDRLEAAVKARPDVIFNLVEHFHDRAEYEPAVAALFELHQVPFTGSGPLALSLCRRKGTAKQLLLANGVPTPSYRLLWTPKIPRSHGLRYPLIVKPAREDASAGVDQDSVVTGYRQLVSRLEQAFLSFGPPMLVEEFIVGREFHASVLGNDPGRMLPLVEYDFSRLPSGRHPIISYAVKWDPLQEDFHRVDSICPPKLGKRIVERIEKVVLAAYRILGARDYARLDIRLDREGRPFVLELNPNPDLTEGVSFMESAEAVGMSFPKTLAAIVEMAAARRPVPAAPDALAAEAPAGDAPTEEDRAATGPAPEAAGRTP